MKVLIVDDEPLGRQLLEAVLMPENYTLFFAENGQEALESTLKNKPDLLLMDVMMPEMDGFEVCKKIRNEPSIATTPVILITALDDRDSRLRGLEAGANDYISKPFDRIEIIAKVKNISLSKSFQNGSTQNERAPEESGTPESAYLQNLFTDTLNSLVVNTLPNISWHVPSKLSSAPVASVQKLEDKEFVFFCGNNLQPNCGALVNSLSLHWFNSLTRDMLDSPSWICNAFDEFIGTKIQDQEKLSDIDAWSVCLKIPKSETSLELAGKNQTAVIRSGSQASPIRTEDLQTFYLLGNQDLRLENMSNAYIFSKAIAENVPPPQLLQLLVKHSHTENLISSVCKEIIDSDIYSIDEQDVFGLKYTL